MSEDVVIRVKAALEDVTPGPWVIECSKYVSGRYVLSDASRQQIQVVHATGTVNVGVDAEFIAASRQLVPELIAEIERLRDAVSMHTPVMTETQDDRWECCDSCGGDWPCPTAERLGEQ
jgi:hypothetical protein